MSAEQRPDDGGEPADDGQPPVEADQRPAGVDVTARSLRDDDADAAGEALHEPRGDRSSTVGLIAQSADVSDVRGDADEQDARRRTDPSGPAISCPAASPIRQAVMVSCAIEVAAPRSAVSAGSAEDAGPSRSDRTPSAAAAASAAARLNAGAGRSGLIGHATSLPARRGSEGVPDKGCTDRAPFIRMP